MRLSSCSVKITALLFAVSIFYSLPLLSHAQVGIPAGGTELDGYAWSDTIGWISMNCKTGGAAGESICPGSPGAGPKSDYKVTISSAGNVTGYAWSSSVGWLKFGGLASFPIAAGSAAVNAQVTGTYADLDFNGWARACSGTFPGDCSSMVSRTDGWDGWISLAGLATNNAAYNVKMDRTGGTNDSYAWGGTVVGWISMDGVVYNPVPPSGSLTITGCTISQGNSTCMGSFTWSLIGASSPNIWWSNPGVVLSTATSGVGVSFAMSYDTNYYELRDGSYTVLLANARADCVPGLDFSNGLTCELVPVAPPTVTLQAGKSIARIGDIVPVTWTITPALSAGSCTLGGPDVSGTVTTSGTMNSSALKSKSRFTITCTGPFTTVFKAVDVEVIPIAREV